MRSLFAKSIIAVFVVLSLGTSLAWASTSSRPGMFLYPLKKTTQKAVQVLKNIPTVEIHLTAATPPPVATDDDQADDPTLEPTSTATATANATSTATATHAPTPAKVADKITPTAAADADPGVAPTSTIAPPLDPPAQMLSVGSLASSDDQSSQQKDESSHDDSSKSKNSSDDSGESDSEEHSSKDSSSEHD